MMTFLSPWLLLLIAPVVALAVGYVVAYRRRRRYAVRFATLPMLERLAPDKPGWRRHAPAGALLLALTVLALAAARPEADLRVPREDATVIVAIDTSLSMEATDVAPSRLEAAQTEAATFIEGLPDTYNVGVVTFSGTTQVLATPTTDHEAASATLAGLRLGTSTAIGEAVFTSLDQLAALTTPRADDDRREETAPEAAQAPPARIILLSDGTNTVGRAPAEASAAAAQARVPVSTIAYGTPGGTVEQQGRSVRVPVDEATLAALAEESGGTAYTAASGAELAEVYGDIGSSIGWRTQPRELAPYLAVGAFLMTLAAAAMSLRWFSRFP